LNSTPKHHTTVRLMKVKLPVVAALFSVMPFRLRISWNNVG
jgi:hypothetical protein